MIAINSTSFYKIDPKDTPVGYIYNILIAFPAFGHLGTLLGFIILLIDYIKFKGKLTSNFFKWIYFIGVALTIFLHYTDLGYCQIWFFD
jgi:hypothetical protein